MWDTTRALGAVALVGTISATAPAAAQPATVEQHTEAVVEAAPEEDTTSLNVSAGMVLTTGNTESFQLNAGSRLELVRGMHSFQAEASYVLSLAGDSYGTETANNVRGRLRYDLFFTPMDAVFAAAMIRRDPFAGLNPRVQGQIGYLRNFLKEENHRFWGEVGYDLTYDRYDYDLLPVDPAMDPTLPDHQVTHSARLFVGYDNHMSENLTYLAGLEGLLNVEDLADLRLNWDNAVRTSIGGNFQAELKFSLLFDNVPVRSAKKLDTTTQLALIYTFI